MKKKTQQEPSPPEAEDVLLPVSVENTSSTKAQEVSIDVPPGHVYIVGLHEDGTEREGSGFFYPESSYKRFYSNEAKYSVKKKAQ